MSPKEVESILGHPTKVETFKIPILTQRPFLDGTRYYYTQDGETIQMHFIEDKLISPASRFGQPSLPEERTKK